MAPALRKHASTIAVAAVTAALTATVLVAAPVVAHGVRHALFAHNAGKLDGRNSTSFMGTNGRSKLFAAVSVEDDGSLSSSIGPVRSSTRLDVGKYRVKFKKNFRARGSEAFFPVVSAVSLEGQTCSWAYDVDEGATENTRDSLLVNCNEASGADSDAFFTLLLFVRA